MSKELKVPHVHAEVIRAWASGEEIEFSFDAENWKPTNNPSWLEHNFYRIKPKEDKNIVLYSCAFISTENNFLEESSEFALSYEITGNFSSIFIPTDNLKLTFNGLTGKLLNAEAVKHKDYK